MKTKKSTLCASSAVAATGILLLALWSCAPEKPVEKAAADVGPAAVALLPEGQVRLSNDPLKTEIFRDAGLGLFIHWGPNSQMGTEISWPLNNASDDYIKKYYALAETFDPVLFDALAWARLAKLAGMVCRLHHQASRRLLHVRHGLQRFQDHPNSLRQRYRCPGR